MRPLKKALNECVSWSAGTDGPKPRASLRFGSLPGRDAGGLPQASPAILKVVDPAATQPELFPNFSHAVDRLRSSEEQFLLLFESIPFPMALHQANGHYLQTNGAYRRMLRYSNEELLRLGAKGVTHPDDIAEGRRLFQELRDGTRDSYHREKRYLRRDGRLVWAQSAASAVRDARGELQFIISMVEDITERKQLEEEVLLISARERQRLGKDLHDGLGQLLTGLALKARVLQEKLAGQSDDEAKDAAEIVQLAHQAATQTRLMARGLFPVELETRGLAAALTELARSTQKLHHVACTLRIGKCFRPPGKAAEKHLYRIVQEAVTNAVKHSRCRNVSIAIQRRSGWCTLAVRDDGAGLAATTPSADGMGLRIIRYRARRIGGQFQIQPARGGGTVVKVRFPR
jgi:PAS domain S-box-containing protein